jgi:hypothetical protein
MTMGEVTVWLARGVSLWLLALGSADVASSKLLREDFNQRVPFKMDEREN